MKVAEPAPKSATHTQSRHHRHRAITQVEETPDTVARATVLMGMRDEITRVVRDVQDVFYEAKRLEDFNVSVSPIGNAGMYRAWIMPSAKVIFSLEGNRVSVMGFNDRGGEGDDGVHAMRLLVKSIIEDPKNQKAIIAATRLCSSGDKGRAWAACTLASRIARQLGLSNDFDDTCDAALRLLDFAISNPSILRAR